MYGQVPPQRGRILYDITHSTMIAAVEHQSDLKLTTDTTYLALTSVLRENWLPSNGTALYNCPSFSIDLPDKQPYFVQCTLYRHIS